MRFHWMFMNHPPSPSTLIGSTPIVFGPNYPSTSPRPCNFQLLLRDVCTLWKGWNLPHCPDKLLRVYVKCPLLSLACWARPGVQMDGLPSQIQPLGHSEMNVSWTFFVPQNPKRLIDKKGKHVTTAFRNIFMVSSIDTCIEPTGIRSLLFSCISCLGQKPGFETKETTPSQNSDLRKRMLVLMAVFLFKVKRWVPVGRCLRSA